MRSSIALFILLLAGLLSCKNNAAQTANAETPVTEATYYLIRHADKERGPDAGTDPDLTAKGLARAEFWAQTLQDVDFDAVYSTDYVRTRKTALPVAQANDLPLTIYDAQNLYDETFQQETAGKTVLVVGHSNTTPAFVNSILGEEKYGEIDDSVFGNLYIVKIKDGQTQVELQEYNDWSFD